MPEAGVAAIILAAGESTRMGQLKPLLPWAGTTLIEWQVGQMVQAGAEDIVVVLGHEAAAIQPAVQRTTARLIVNETYREGRASSLRRGAEAVPDVTGAVLVLSVDQPRPGWVGRRLIERWRERPAPLVLPSFDGHRDHPVLVDGSLLPELRRVTEAGLGLRAVIERHEAQAELVEIENPAVRVDLNTVDDYNAALGSLAAGAWEENVSKV